MKHCSITTSILIGFLFFSLTAISQNLHVEVEGGEAALLESQGISAWLTLKNSQGINTYLWAAANDTYLDNRIDGGKLLLRGNSEVGLEVDFERALTVDNNLDVGIGTAFPDAKLHVNGDGPVAIFDGNNPFLSFKHNGENRGFLQSFNDQFIISTPFSDQIDFVVFAGTDNSAAIKIDAATDNIGIYDTTPEARLAIGASVNALDVGQRSGNNLGYLNVERPLSADGTNVIAKFKDNGSTRMIVDDLNANYQLILFGDAFASGGMWTNSDKRLKKDIQVLEGSLDKVMQLKPSSYKYNTKEAYPFLGIKDEVRIGFIAQELEEIFPESVRLSTFIDTDGDEAVEQDLYAVNYQSLIPVLTKAIQEQQTMIDQLQSTLENTNQQLTALKQQMNK